MSGERTERATPRRRQKAQQQGDRVRSRELTAAFAMLAGVQVLGNISSHWASMWSGLMTQVLALGSPAVWQEDQAMQTALALRHLVLIAASPLLLLALAVSGVALFVVVAQGGGVQFSAQALQPKFTRLNPLTNIKNILSLQGASRMMKSLLPAGVIVILGIHKIEGQTNLPPMSIGHLPRMFSSAYDLLLDTAWILVAWSGIDYIVQWRSWEGRMRMSKQEIREEMKETEGSPQVRSRIRGLQRQMRRRKLKADVKRATVVITNPTHYAVALSFDFETMEPPKVLAKGRNLLAEQIKSEARWAGVPIVENPPLARSLYRSVAEGQSIPIDLYAAVAAILAYLYRKQVEEKVRRQRAAEQAKRDQRRKDAAPAQPISRSAKEMP
ncbi:EscU/YscU/HrcU family type III secretion system export apparatus switch protein [Alloacidobacterium dinghuense]|uniref:EscU/YscU/HrcU family type III secretion system export apparatus switch protein n=1 Tax=Alloacidobacterium dinghuense TaxID=2763107 RepID=A0A7G8BNN4_9BACT|nr:EscU/YscU/HrcU family type III secretion system export apparatus switch protein [Alloacidobacterium dinghuense]QNI34154.1 EscU/YscU/HrcU family type III secretion system export apparatus switch protein [Alloacidobacterium dinghuense]